MGKLHAHVGAASRRVGFAERTRIARDLHDTLLQSFHGLLLRFQTAFNLLPDRPAESKQVLASAIDQAAEAITEVDADLAARVFLRFIENFRPPQ